MSVLPLPSTGVAGQEESPADPQLHYDRGTALVVWRRTEPFGVSFHFGQIHADRRTGDVAAEVKVYAGSNGSADQLYRTRVNDLRTNGRAQTDMVRHLDERLPGPDWKGMVPTACWMVVDAQREGRPPILLRDAPPSTSGGMVLRPLLLEKDPVMGFGDGGNAKSYLGLALALTLHTGRPLVAGLKPATTLRTAYLDFEWVPEPHKKRMQSLWGEGELPDLVYVPCGAEGPLAHQIDRLRAIVIRQRIQYVVIDSVALACEGPPEDAAVALAFFQALARLEVGSLLLAHVNRAGDVDKPFGSAFWSNSARATWYIKRVQEVGDAGLDLGLYNRKFNDGAPAAPVGLHFEFAADRTTITSTDVAAVAALAGGLSLKQRIVAILRRGALTYPEIAEQLEADPDTVRKTVKRHEEKTFVILPGIDRLHRVALRSEHE